MRTVCGQGLNFGDLVIPLPKALNTYRSSSTLWYTIDLYFILALCLQISRWIIIRWISEWVKGLVGVEYVSIYKQEVLACKWGNIDY